VGELEIVTVGAKLPPESLPDVIGPVPLEILQPVRGEWSGAAVHQAIAALRCALVVEEQTIAVVDQPCEPIYVLVEGGHIPGYGAHPIVEERRQDPADAIGLHDGVRVHHHDDVGLALLPGHRSLKAVEVEPHQGAVVPAAVDGGLLRQALAPITGFAPSKDVPVGPLRVSLVHRQERLDVRGPVVDDQETELALVVLLIEGLQASFEDVGMLVVGRDDDVHARWSFPDVRKPLLVVVGPDRDVASANALLQAGVRQDDDGVGAEEQGVGQRQCRRHRGITR
jgi:hypothetical protein